MCELKSAMVVPAGKRRARLQISTWNKLRWWPRLSGLARGGGGAVPLRHINLYGQLTAWRRRQSSPSLWESDFSARSHFHFCCFCFFPPPPMRLLWNYDPEKVSRWDSRPDGKRCCALSLNWSRGARRQAELSGSASSFSIIPLELVADEEVMACDGKRDSWEMMWLQSSLDA